jgi:hypothetical protein
MPSRRSSGVAAADILARVLAGFVGGYALASAASLSLSIVLPLPRADAVLAATLPSFAVLAGAIIWAFAARSAIFAWTGILVPAALLVGVAAF